MPSPQARKIADIGELTLFIPTSGGKAGAGCNRTSTIQVRNEGSLLRQFRFNTADSCSFVKAMDKAREWAQEYRPLKSL